MKIALVIGSTLALFLLMILLLASKPKFAGKITSTFIAIAGISGLLFYGYGFAVTVDDLGLAILRALVSVCKMYVGSIDLGSISGAPLMQNTWAQILFYIVHLLALYATASAAITTVGAQALRKLRLWLARWGHLNLIYGVNENTIALGKALLKKKNSTVVFIDSGTSTNDSNAIAQAGCVLRSDDAALAGNEKFLQAVGGNRKDRKITLYAMQTSASANRQFAASLMETLEKTGAKPENTQLVIRCPENSTAIELQVLGERYGYGAVTLIQEAALAARLLVRSYPPCDTLHFDENCRATDNFEAVIVGFGQVGQAVLRQLVMNGQFEGSRFHAAVFAPDCKAIKGPFSKNFPEILKQYAIDFHACDARSEEMYDYLQALGTGLKYIAVCTGSDRLNNEIAENLAEFFRSMGLELPILLCTHSGVTAFPVDGGVVATHSLYQAQVLDMAELDAMARIINHHYQGDPDCADTETWKNCDFFSRMSCRASADFLPAMLRMAGVDAQQVRREGLNLTDTQLENLSITEHLRWCAFHYCMGFIPMSEKEYDQREEKYRQQVAAGEKPLRIGKNMAGRTHSCLIEWDDLDALSARENSVTGKNVDYKDMDRENVRVIPKLLRSLKQGDDTCEAEK